MKILFLSNHSPYPIHDGSSRRTYNILKCMARDYKVHLLSLYSTPEEIDPNNIDHLNQFCETVEMFPALLKKPGIRMASSILRSIFSVLPYTVLRHYSQKYLQRIHELIMTAKFDLVHCDALPIAYSVNATGTVPFILTDHDVSYIKAFRMADQCKNPFLKYFLYLEGYKLKRFEKSIFRRCKLVIAVSEKDRDALRKISSNTRYEVIENGVDTNVFKPSTQDIETNTLLWVGGFENYPNKEAVFYFLREIYPDIKENHDLVKLNLVGHLASERLRTLASIDKSIDIIGYVDDITPYLQRAAIFIAPILSGSGTRLKILEAMACGMAIVTTSMGCEGLSGINGVHYIVADSPDEFSKSVVEILSNKVLRTSLGQNARKFAEERYDWDYVCKKMNAIYEGLKG